MKTENLIPSEGNEEQKCYENHKKHKIGFGIVVVAIGAMLLTNTIHPHFFEMKFVWPVIIILIGLKWIFKSNNCQRCCHNKRRC